MSANSAGSMLAPTTGRTLPPPPGLPPMGSGAPAGAMPMMPQQPLPGPTGMPALGQGQPQQYQQPQQQQAPAPPPPVAVGNGGQFGLPVPPGLPGVAGQPWSPAAQVAPPAQSAPVAAATTAPPPPSDQAAAKPRRTRGKKADAPVPPPPDPKISFQPSHVNTVGAAGSPVTSPPVPTIGAPVGMSVGAVAPAPARAASAIVQSTPFYADPDDEGVFESEDAPGADGGDDCEPEVGTATPNTPPPVSPVASAPQVAPQAIQQPPTPGAQFQPAHPPMAIATNEAYAQDFISTFSLGPNEPQEEMAQLALFEASVQGILNNISRQYGITAAYDVTAFDARDAVQSAVHFIRFRSLELPSTPIDKLNEMKAVLSAHVVAVLSYEGRARATADRLGKFYGGIMDARVSQAGGDEKVKDRQARILREDKNLRTLRYQYFLAEAVAKLFENMAEAFENLTHSLNRVIDEKMRDRQMTR